jgi:GGDEF domain-containing protein
VGGDEFALLLWNCGEADARTKADAIELAVQRTTATHAGQAIAVGGSCGETPILPLDRAADLMERADRAMYARKAARNRPQAAAG